MSGDHLFVDTNILVYAHDSRAGAKHNLAREKVKSLWERAVLPSISVQVLQECYVNCVRKGIGTREASGIVRDFLQWNVVVNDALLLLEGIAHAERWKISLWDALILAAAKRAKASIVWSEDLNPGQDYDGVRVVNPLV